MTVKERFNNLTPRNKKVLVWSAVGLIVMGIAVTGYNSRAKKSMDVVGTEKNKTIHLDPDMIEKTMLKEQGRQIDALNKGMADLTKSYTDFLAIEEKKRKDAESSKLIIPTPEQLSVENQYLYQYLGQMENKFLMNRECRYFTIVNNHQAVVIWDHRLRGVAVAVATKSRKGRSSARFQ